MWTTLPFRRRSVPSGTTRKQLEREKDTRSPEPCEGTVFATGSSAAAGLKSQKDGTNRVKSGLPFMSLATRARAKLGLWGRLPASAARIGEPNSRKVTADEMGFPGRPKKGSLPANWPGVGAAVPGTSPKTRGLPGCGDGDQYGLFGGDFADAAAQEL